MASLYFFSALLLTVVVSVPNSVSGSAYCGPVVATDKDLVQFPLNLEFLEAEFFLSGALGHGLDAIEPDFAAGGPPPIGAQKANLDPVTRKIIEEFGYQEVGHLRAIITAVGGIPRPLYDLINYLLASYAIPYVGLVGYVGTIPYLTTYSSRALVASLLGVESGQDAVIRTLLYEKAHEKVMPYNITVAEFTNAISFLRNELAMCGVRDEGLIVPLPLGAENRTESNILSADSNSRSYARTQPQILRIVYGTGSEYKPGGFLPRGGNGKIARSFLDKA
ncbi:DESICCATION-LIKE PROTEIN [Salix koriyanagi]|uniref:DESICCATION-LIKE PROTEIN n=1 Tax=Salix koriyanagi TaxID=2511006 RepID=A0A9Q1ALX6_9ROSI|nr:DESICCATION-LIKE PROTEIN [Salix koriyanagi]